MFSNATRPRPNWSGFMQHIFSGEQATPKSEVILLPIIDLNPSDETCVYSTLLYIQSQAERLNIPTPCITFDQPLWPKAVEIIKAKSLNIVCRLGGFHTMMSFMGSIGSMMKSSGLEEALETAYGPNAVTHMMSMFLILLFKRPTQFPFVFCLFSLYLSAPFLNPLYSSSPPSLLSLLINSLSSYDKDFKFDYILFHQWHILLHSVSRHDIFF